jgi:DNA-binding FadR family transcriptional regulator
MPRGRGCRHQRIVDAIVAGDAEAAAAAIIEVIHNGMRRHEGPAIVPAEAGDEP